MNDLATNRPLKVPVRVVPTGVWLQTCWAVLSVPAVEQPQPSRAGADFGLIGGHERESGEPDILVKE